MAESNPITSQTSKEFELDLLNTFLDTKLGHLASKGVPKDYLISEFRKQKYKKITDDDEDFKELIKKKYGSIENFFTLNESLRQNRVFDPLEDYEIEVEIITEDQYLKSDFISSQEVFLEILDGIATIQYFKTNGNIAQITGTLNKKYLPSSQYETRDQALGGFGGRRILIWDHQKQGWSSFYMNRVRRFVRDDTTDLQ